MPSPVGKHAAESCQYHTYGADTLCTSCSAERSRIHGFSSRELACQHSGSQEGGSNCFWDRSWCRLRRRRITRTLCCRASHRHFARRIRPRLVDARECLPFPLVLLDFIASAFRSSSSRRPERRCRLLIHCRRNLLWSRPEVMIIRIPMEFLTALTAFSKMPWQRRTTYLPSFGVGVDLLVTSVEAAVTEPPPITPVIG